MNPGPIASDASAVAPLASITYGAPRPRTATRGVLANPTPPRWQPGRLSNAGSRSKISENTSPKFAALRAQSIQNFCFVNTRIRNA
jgi:hypothetical protein